MPTKTASSDDSSSSSLARAFKRLTFRSPLAASSSSSSIRPNKPLPRPPSLPPQHDGSQQTNQVTSFPPYLAHLAAPPHTSYAHVRFPDPYLHLHLSHDLAQPQPLPPRPYVHPQSRPSAGITLGHDDRVNSRPPVFVSRPDPPHHRYPESLKPGPITVNPSPSQKLAYPWELVPQRKPSSVDSLPQQPQPHGKENRTTAPSHTSKALVETPPRRRPSSTTTSALVSLTPNGSQADPKHAPVKGQCWGMKKDGSRCTRKVKTTSSMHTPSRTDRGASAPARLVKGASPSAPLAISSDEDGPSSPKPVRSHGRSATPSSETASGGDEADEAYCYQHIAEAKKLPGFYHSYPRTGNTTLDAVFIKYDDWISASNLNDHTQVLIRSCMARQLTDTDRAELGHLYIHELLACSTETHICLKVGRSTQVFRRIGEWDSQCRSKQPLLRAIFPAQQDQDLMPHKATPTMEGVQFSRRWEALVHLELAGSGKRLDQVCHDCGKRHREVFMIPRRPDDRDDKMRNKAGGIDLAERVVVKWLQFVQLLASP